MVKSEEEIKNAPSSDRIMAGQNHGYGTAKPRMGATGASPANTADNHANAE